MRLAGKRNTFFFMRRCLNGRKVACIRSKEIATRLATEISDLQKGTIVTQYLKLNDQVEWNKHDCNRQADHQVHATRPLSGALTSMLESLSLKRQLWGNSFSFNSFNTVHTFLGCFTEICLLNVL